MSAADGLPGHGPPRTIDARWSADETDPAGVAAALRRLETTRRSDGSAVTPGRALTLVVIVDPEHDDPVRDQLRLLGARRASRTIIVRRDAERRRLRGRAAVIADDRVGSALHETVVLDLGPRDERDLDGILDPLVITDVPTVGWAPAGPGIELLLSIAPLLQAAITDSDSTHSVQAALADAATLLDAGVRPVDFAWLRSAPWRIRLAALAREQAGREILGNVRRLDITSAARSPRCGELLAGWLAERLGWQPGPPLLTASGSRISIGLHPGPPSATGLDDVRLTCADGTVRSIARSPGGLRIRDHSPDGTTAERTMIGGSRMATGLLPSALRHALLPGDLDHDVLEMTAALDRADALTAHTK